MLDDDDHYPRARVRKEDLYPGRAVVYRPDMDHPNFDPSEDTDVLPWGTLGIYIGLGEGWEKFVRGHEPIEVLFGVTGGRVIRIYMDEIELV